MSNVRGSVSCNAALSLQETGDDCTEAVEVFFKDPMHTANNPHPETVESELESSPSEMDEVSSAKKGKEANEEATSATEGPPKEEAPILKAKKEGCTLDAKEETLDAEAASYVFFMFFFSLAVIFFLDGFIQFLAFSNESFINAFTLCANL